MSAEDTNDNDIENDLRREIEEALHSFSEENQPKNEILSQNYKIEEYVERIKNGESLESFGDIPESWKFEILRILESATGLDNEHKQVVYENKEFFDFDEQAENVTPYSEAIVNIEENKKLTGWDASYKLAEIAKEEGVDLSVLSREEYALYAINKYLAIDDTQLRAHPLQRNGISVDEVVKIAREVQSKIEPKTEKIFKEFSFEMKALSEKPQSERFLFGNDDIRVSSQTAKSDSWLFFTINSGMDSESSEAYKSYFSFKNLNELTPERFGGFMIFLQQNGYNGSVKIFQDLEFQGSRLNDQVVMHGYSESDSKLGLYLAKQYFDKNIGSSSLGKDEEIDGKNMSYSEILAKKILDTIKQN